MADKRKTEAEEPADETDEIVPESGKRGGGKKLLLFILLPILLLGGGGAGAYFSGVLDPFLGGHAEDEEAMAEEEEVVAAGPGVYYDLPEMLVNLNSSGRRSNYLRVVVSLELDTEADVARIEEVMPRVIDNFQVFLRELRVEDLRGSAGMYRLREELLMRVSEAAKPAHVRDVLFREMLVQ